jgi:hypothetical protein
MRPNPRFWKTVRVLALTLVSAVLLINEVGAAKKKPKPKPSPSGSGVTINGIVTQLRGLFAAWDLNGDGFLDKEELAKAFRGANARPFDYQKPTKEKEDPVSLAFLPESFLSSTPPLAAIFTTMPTYSTTLVFESFFAKPLPEEKPTSTKKTDYSGYPDYIFLTQLDKNNDQKISKTEFNSWALDYARQLKPILDAQARLAKAEQQYLNATTAAARRNALQQYQRFQRELANLANNIKAIDKKLYQAMKKSSKGRKR